MKIAGVIPIGGSALRLGLPPTMSKEMLPRVGMDRYSPVAEELVNQMSAVGAHQIVFVHGPQFKVDVLSYFCDPRFTHCLQQEKNFAGALLAAKKRFGDAQAEDIVLFGLPDTVRADNPFPSLVETPGTACALFRATDRMKVDRLDAEGQFDVKSERKPTNGRWFWGAFKTTLGELWQAEMSGCFAGITEIGHLLNLMRKKHKKFGRFLDLGTWPSLNAYYRNWGRD